jgi:hypothetical protein
VHAQERFKPAWAPPQLDGILKYSPGKAAKCRTLRVFEIFFSALHAAPFRLLVTRFDLPAYINTDIAKTASTPDAIHVLHAFSKKSQKTAQRDLALANARLRQLKRGLDQ